MCRFLSSVALAALVAGCGPSPRVIFHVTSLGAGSLDVAACKDGETSADCFSAGQTHVISSGQTAAQAAIFDIPASVTSFPMVFQTDQPACERRTVTLDQNPLDINIDVGVLLKVDCGTSCGPPCVCGMGACP